MVGDMAKKREVESGSKKLGGDEFLSNDRRGDDMSLKEEPSIETVIELVKEVEPELPGDSPSVVMARRERTEFVPYDSGNLIRFRAEMLKLSKQGFHPVGLVIWETTQESAESKRQLFPWLRDEPEISRQFDEVCKAYAVKCREEFERRSIQ